MDRVFEPKVAKSGFLKKPLFGFNIDVRFKKPNIAFGNRCTPRVAWKFVSPFLRRGPKYGNDRIVDASPQTRGRAHDLSHRGEISWSSEKPDSGGSQSYLGRKFHGEFLVYLIGVRLTLL